jgi:transcriptional regulator with XRE-family HTH domain
MKQSKVKKNPKCNAATLAIAKDVGRPAAMEAKETPEQRVQRLYTAQGGPLIGWLLDEARRRGMELQEMAKELGVTYGYVHHLRTGIRKTCQVSHDFASNCARFLGVPTVVVMLLSGYLTMSDFATRAESDDEAVERALRLMQDDPHIRASVPVDFSQMCAEGKRAVVMMYGEVAGRDVFQVGQLPEVLRWLQRAALMHDENEAAVIRGHRGVLDRDE